MSNTKTIGGPAFPCKTERWDNDFGEDGGFVEDHEEGMTLRDYFAAKAMTAIVLMENAAHREGYMFEGWQALAQDCYNWADAMLKAREQ